MKQAAVLTLVVALSMAFVFTGDDEAGSQVPLAERTDTSAERVFAWLCLILTPVGLGVGHALNRALRKLDESTVSVFSNTFQMLVFWAIVSILGQDAGFFRDFTWVEWLVMAGSSAFHVLS